jgi:hypothetical protein
MRSKEKNIITRSSIKIESSSSSGRCERKQVSRAGLANNLACARRTHLPVEGYVAIAAVVVILLIVVATLPGLSW